MKKNKLFYYYRSLTKAESLKFAKYARYEKGNKQQKINDLIVFLDKNIAKNPPEKYDELKLKAFNEIFPNTAYNSLKMSRLQGAVFALLKNFLILEEKKLETVQAGELLRKTLRRRHLGEFYLEELEAAKNKLKISPARDFYYHQNMGRLQHDIYFNVDLNQMAKKDLLDDLIVIHQGVDAGYLLAKLHYTCQMVAIQRLRGQRAQTSNIDMVLEMAQNKDFKKIPLVQLYLRLLAFLKETTEESYETFKDDMFQSFYLFSKELQLQLFVLLINVSWLTVARSQWPKAVFSLYEYGLENKLLLDNGIMSPSHFNNIVDIGCSLGKFDRIRLFIKNHLPHLNIADELEENVRTLYESFLYFGQKKYDKVLQHLNFLEFKDCSYGLRAYKLVIKSLYESKKEQGFEEIEKQCHSFMQYVQRKYKQGFISEAHKEENFNFIKIIRQLPYASSSQFAKVRDIDLMNRLLEMERVVSRSWLIAKIKALKGS